MECLKNLQFNRYWGHLFVQISLYQLNLQFNTRFTYCIVSPYFNIVYEYIATVAQEYYRTRFVTACVIGQNGAMTH